MQSYPNIPTKANRKQTAVKLTASKIGTHVMATTWCRHSRNGPGTCSYQIWVSSA